MSHLLRGSGFASWRQRVIAVGDCAKPVRLAGSTHMLDAAGARFSEAGSIFAPCNNRRETVCPPCAARYSGDTFHVIHSGLTGGKGVPDTVIGYVRVFTPLTPPPSFGPGHTRPTTKTGRARAFGCGEFHSEHDPRLGTPVDPEGYNYVGAVLWQAHATEQWRRFTITTARHLAATPAGQLREHLRISYAKWPSTNAAAWSTSTPSSASTAPIAHPPAGVTKDLLCAVIRAAVAVVRVSTPDSAAVGVRELCWGHHVDTAPIAAHEPGDPARLAADMQVAGYIAKYATKGTAPPAWTAPFDVRNRSPS